MVALTAVAAPEYASSGGLPHISFAQWYRQFARDWQQGEHVAVIGQTGSGKTSLVGQVLAIRDHVVALAVKRRDDTIDHMRGKYTVITKWPPAYNQSHVVVWLRPESLSFESTAEQSGKAFAILDHVFRDGGWGLFLDDTGYLAGTLRLHQPITILLNQGRSSGISVVSAMTQPSSVTARVPSEAFRQCRHILTFRYRNRRDIQSIADMTGYDWQDVGEWMNGLSGHDFLAFSGGGVIQVHNTRTERNKKRGA